MDTSTPPREPAAAAAAAALWAVVFAAFHVYWALGGGFGLGDGSVSEQGVSGGFLVYLVVAVMCLVGAGVARELGRGAGRSLLPRWMLLTAAWTAAALLLARGGIGVIDDLLRTTGVLTHGLSGLSLEQVYGDPDPSAYTMWSMRAVDLYFLLGGALFTAALHGFHRPRRRSSTDAEPKVG
ncbi:DUF3995 domain-containing protein [Streptomyces sp. SAJ15]|uniref:DUF3995 domain-containing protein n=1 Tax=Streptomyces sp. SAJ15 TaxID=2011095 RepID=UPI001184757F|nr:DUF3995 domain-containing protein [Streptomyces sp. SAJ15]TVL89305.1 hypothetical protein CD790_27835 [Streptomyces sp. SAJ15]